MTMTAEEQELAIRVLACPMVGDRSGSEAKTVGHFLFLLGREVWREGECFNGKRPFGNSSWNWDIYRAIISAGIVEDDRDDDGSGHVRSECDEVIDHALNFMERMAINIPLFLLEANR